MTIRQKVLIVFVDSSTDIAQSMRGMDQSNSLALHGMGIFRGKAVDGIVLCIRTRGTQRDQDRDTDEHHDQPS